jgi:hypothetical protein
MSGWGAHLEQYPDGLGTVRNVAKGGATTTSHRAEGLWGSLLQACRPGDWVLIQFGHNDQKLPELDPDGGYTKNLEIMEVRARDATPVLCTAVERRYFESGRIVPSHRRTPAGPELMARPSRNVVARDVLHRSLREPFGASDRSTTRAISTREETLSLLNRLRRCVSTVLGLRKSASAISGFDLRSTTSRAI